MLVVLTRMNQAISHTIRVWNVLAGHSSRSCVYSLGKGGRGFSVPSGMGSAPVFRSHEGDRHSLTRTRYAQAPQGLILHQGIHIRDEEVKLGRFHGKVSGCQEH